MSDDRMQAFGNFALAFEKSYAADDWRDVEAHMTEGVVWAVQGAPAPFGGAWQGRDAALAAIRTSVGGFDRRFDAREPRVVDGPTPIPGGIHMRWAVTYRREGVPPIELHGEEWDFFRDGKLDFHRESIHNADELLAHLATYGARLRPQR